MSEYPSSVHAGIDNAPDRPPQKGIDLDRLYSGEQRPTVLIVDDDHETVELLKTVLRNEGMNVVGALDGFQALSKLGELNADIILLDLMMPDFDGWETFQRLRELSDTPVVIISARATKEHVVEGLESGVDDYITKPFHLPEVAARVRAVLRRSPASLSPKRYVYPERELVIEPSTHLVSLRGELIDLSPNEFALIEVLAERAPRPATYEQITHAVWDDNEVQRDRIKYLVHHLRKKVEPEPDKPELIVTRTMVGYQLDAGQRSRTAS